MRPEPPDNALRHRPGATRHVESYFLRGNDPSSPRAFWLKATVLAPKNGEAVAEAWFIWFDGVKGRTFAHRVTVPIHQAHLLTRADGEADLRVAGTSLETGPAGQAEGSLERSGVAARWNLTWSAERTRSGERLSIYPWRLLREGPFPKSKLLTPYPALRFSGALEVAGERIPVDGWSGMQGHNWGKEHPFQYAWGHCLFPARGGEPEAMVEGFSGQVRVAGLTTPRLSALVVRRGQRELRFDRIFDAWAQRAQISQWRWELELASDDGRAKLSMDAAGRPMVCLGYQNPDRSMRYCFNSKLARVRVEVAPASGPPFTLESEHGGALELLSPHAHADFPEVV